MDKEKIKSYYICDLKDLAGATSTTYNTVSNGKLQKSRTIIIGSGMYHKNTFTTLAQVEYKKGNRKPKTKEIKPAHVGKEYVYMCKSDKLVDCTGSINPDSFHKVFMLQ